MSNHEEPLKIKFTPKQITQFETIRVPGMNNSGGNRYRKNGVQAQQHQIQEAKRKEEKILSRMEMRPTLKRQATISEKLKGKKDEYKQIPQIVGMSGTDPVGEFIISGIGLNGVGVLAKGSKALYKAYKAKEAISTARQLAARQATNTFKQTRLDRITDRATNKQVKSAIQSMMTKKQIANLAKQKADFANTLFWNYTKRETGKNIKKITNPLSYDTGVNMFQNWWNTNY